MRTSAHPPVLSFVLLTERACADEQYERYLRQVQVANMTEYSEPDAILVRHKALMETHREQMTKQKEVSETLEAVRQEYVAFVKVRSGATRRHMRAALSRAAGTLPTDPRTRSNNTTRTSRQTTRSRVRCAALCGPCCFCSPAHPLPARPRA